MLKVWKKIDMNPRCKTCMYRGDGRTNGCDYILITGHSRGCSVNECTQYRRKSKNRSNIPWSGKGLQNV